MNPGQGPKTPDCGCTHGEDKHYPDQLIRRGSLAPALEHRDESNHEQQDCTRAQSLKPHGRSPVSPERASLPSRQDRRKCTSHA